uniref:Galactoside O-acetyltransferase LacA n=1 Tax=Ganoderma boninense TaxID=34458 RepID=A0A5K1JU87_9APHY|nr:Galactoside O-acetyltransferase LacA [Ganoderma boninense]
MGPRRPDKRNAAYESIFGRPSAQHHSLHPGDPGQFPPPPAQYQQQQFPPQQQPPAQQYPYYPQYPSQPDRRTSTSSYRPYQQQAPPNAFNQPYYPNSTPPPPTSVSPSLGYQPQAYGRQQYGYAASLAPPSVTSRARSIGSSPGVIAPLPEETPDPSLDALTQTGLTPAQAYQAQVYRSSGPMGQQQSWPQQQRDQSPAPASTSASPTLAKASPRGPRPQSVQTMPAVPEKFPELRISMHLEGEDGRLGLDFSSGGGYGNGSGSHAGAEATPPSGPATEDDFSELPYSLPNRNSTPNSTSPPAHPMAPQHPPAHIPFKWTPLWLPRKPQG